MPKPKLSLAQIIDLLNKWNSDRNGANYRNELRSGVGWKPGMNFGELVIDDALACAPGPVPSALGSRDFTELSFRMQVGDIDVSDVGDRMAEWDGTDPRGKMRMPSAQARMRVDEFRRYEGRFSTLHPSAQSTLLVLCNAFTAWLQEKEQNELRERVGEAQ